MDASALVAGLLDPLALAIVPGGALLGGVLRGGFAGLASGFRALRPAFVADPEADAHAAAFAVGRVEQITEAKSLPCADRVDTTGRFLRTAIRHLSDARASGSFVRWAEEDAAARRRRHALGIAFWQDVADAAPAMGMLATVLGLIAMFQHMDDPARIGPPMATALVATLWGLVLANLVAGPLADRLERLSAAEREWQARTIDHFATLARTELDHAVSLQRTLARRLAQ